MNVKVTGCKDCLMWDNDYEYGDICSHPKSPIDNELAYEWINDNKSPDWCPLNKEPITIEKV